MSLMREFHWIYVSELVAGAEQPADTLATIRCVSQERNRSLEVTGTLVFTGRRFAQYLEGREAAIVALRASIERDPRHRRLVTIGEGPIGTRRFGRWDLSYSGQSSFVDQMVEGALRDGTGSGSGRARLVRLLIELAAEDAD